MCGEVPPFISFVPRRIGLLGRTVDVSDPDQFLVHELLDAHAGELASVAGVLDVHFAVPAFVSLLKDGLVVRLLWAASHAEEGDDERQRHQCWPHPF